MTGFTIRGVSGTVNVSIGTTLGGSEVYPATTIVAGDIVSFAAGLLLSAFLTNQSIFINSTSWGGASVLASGWFNP